MNSISGSIKVMWLFITDYHALSRIKFIFTVTILGSSGMKYSSLRYLASIIVVDLLREKIVKVICYVVKLVVIVNADKDLFLAVHSKL